MRATVVLVALVSFTVGIGVDSLVRDHGCIDMGRLTTDLVAAQDRLPGRSWTFTEDATASSASIADALTFTGADPELHAALADALARDRRIETDLAAGLLPARIRPEIVGLEDAFAQVVRLVGAVHAC